MCGLRVQGSSTRAVFLNGVLHGFSWDGTPTLAPALAFNAWGPVMLFLISYGACGAAVYALCVAWSGSADVAPSG